MIVLVVLLVIMISGGIYWYFTTFKSLIKEISEFLHVAFEALKDKKLTVVEKEQLLNELLEMKPLVKDLKTKFVDDAEKLGVEIKELYESLKAKIKGSK
jgi:DNA-binding transcriptional regulator YhcF (GntR family)